jgi:Ni/Co efflux regulator RcnB
MGRLIMKKTLVMTVALLTATGPAFAAGSVQAQERPNSVIETIAEAAARGQAAQDGSRRDRGDRGGRRGGGQQGGGGDRGGQQGGGGDRGGRGGQQGGGDRGGWDRGGQQGGGDRGGRGGQQGGGDRGGWDRGGQQGGGGRGDWNRGGNGQYGGWDRRDRSRPEWRRDRDRDRDHYRGSWNHDHWRNSFNRRHTGSWWRNNNWFRGYSGLRVNFYFAPGYGYYSVPRQYYGRSYQIGDYLPNVFWRYRVHDWAWYGLPAPPSGCAWVYVDNSIFLVDLFDGYIIDTAYQVWRW